MQKIDLTAYLKALRGMVNRRSLDMGDRFSTHPVRDWLVALACAGVVALILAAYSAYLFIGVSSGRSIGAEVSSQDAPNEARREQLQAALERFEERSAAYERLRESPPQTFDPSL